MKLTDDDLARLFDAHAGDLLKYFTRRIADYQAAVDLTSETFAQALATRRRFKGKSIEDARPWLFGIAKNLLRRYYRSGRIERRAMERVGMERAVVAADDIAEFEAFAEIADLKETIESNWDAIPPEQQEAIRQRVLLGREYDVIAREAGVAEGTIRSRVSRGLQFLHDVISADAGRGLEDENDRA